MNHPYPSDGLQAEDIHRLQQEAYRLELLETAKKGENVTLERMLAIESRVKRKVRELTPEEHDERP